MRVSVLDTGAGNLHSLLAALQGLDVRVEGEAGAAIAADLLVLPGVGAFAPAAARIAPALPSIRAAIGGGLPVIGICLGMQLLLDASEEGPGEGIGVIAGTVRALTAGRVPHMGWSELEGLPDLRCAYFAHGFACQPLDPADVIAWTCHGGVRIPAALRRGRVAGVQFHPEKSGRAGRSFLRRLVGEVTS